VLRSIKQIHQNLYKSKTFFIWWRE
jgi:hypothetical protein